MKNYMNVLMLMFHYEYYFHSKCSSASSFSFSPKQCHSAVQEVKYSEQTRGPFLSACAGAGVVCNLITGPHKPFTTPPQLCTSSSTELVITVPFSRIIQETNQTLWRGWGRTGVGPRNRLHQISIWTTVSFTRTIRDCILTPPILKNPIYIYIYAVLQH